MTFVLALILGAAIGSALGYGIFANRNKGKGARAAHTADKLVADAEAKAKEIQLAAQDEALKIRQQGKDEEVQRRKSLEASEKRVAAREEALDRKEKTLEERLTGIEKDKEEITAARAEVKEIKDRQVANLEKVAKLKQDKAKEVLLKMVETEFSDQMARKVRQMENDAKEEGEARAKKIIAEVIQRYAADQSAELTVTTVNIPNEEVKGRIIGKEGRNIQSFEKATGVDLIVFLKS